MKMCSCHIFLYYIYPNTFRSCTNISHLPKKFLSLFSRVFPNFLSVLSLAQIPLFKILALILQMTTVIVTWMHANYFHTLQLLATLYNTSTLIPDTFCILSWSHELTWPEKFEQNCCVSFWIEA